jgi:hypothetical protein
VCREQSVDKLGEIEHRITIVPNATDDREVKRAVTGRDGVLVPLGMHGSRRERPKTVLDQAQPGRRLVCPSSIARQRHLTRAMP